MRDGITLKQSRANSIKNLKAVEPMIRESGIKVGLENVWNGFFLSHYDMVIFLDELQSDCIGLYFDLGNMVAFSDSAFWCEIVGSRTVRIHVKDFKRNNGINSGGVWVNLLRGDLDFPRAMAALKATGFDGYLTAEVFKGSDESFESFLHDVSTAEDEIIGYYNAN
jgi:hexulose-6-phosphate isomerase